MKTKSNIISLEEHQIDEFLRSNIVGVLSMLDRASTYAIPLAYKYHLTKNNISAKL